MRCVEPWRFVTTFRALSLDSRALILVDVLCLLCSPSGEQIRTLGSAQPGWEYPGLVRDIPTATATATATTPESLPATASCHRSWSAFVTSNLASGYLQVVVPPCESIGNTAKCHFLGTGV